MFKNIIIISILTLLALADSPVVKTGQTTSYRTGDDGTYQKGTAHSYFREPITGNIVDSATGLRWQDTYVGGIVKDANWSEAQAYCSSFNDGWRLPSIEELMTITDKSRYEPAIDPIFEKIAYNPTDTLDGYWSATEFSKDNRIWSVAFDRGDSIFNEKNATLHVRCVKSQPIFKLGGYSRNSGLEVVYDSQTDLTWQDDKNAYYGNNKHEWNGAIDYCQSLTLAGVNDWRLPNINELFMIADRSTHRPAIEYMIFKYWSVSGDEATYWSSTTHADVTSNAWYVYFCSGVSQISSKSGTYAEMAVRCVRDGEIKPVNPALIQYLLD